MPLADIIQRIIHFLDVGRGPKYFRVALVGLVLLGLLGWYDKDHFKNFSAPEAMDSAQLARNLADGRGYTTDCIMPFSIFLERKWNLAHHENQPGATAVDLARLKNHPDLAHPPVYPLFEAALMKVLPFHFFIQFGKFFWSEGGGFARYEPDFLIAVANQLLLLVVAAQIFFIARKLFDLEAAVATVILVLGCETLWKFSVSGLPTILVMIAMLGAARLLMAFEGESRQAAPSEDKLLRFSVAAGAVIGLGCLTLYSFGWIAIPATAFVAIFGGRSRGRYGLAVFGTFLVVIGPWLARNFWVSGTPLGTAGFAAMSDSYIFPGARLEESMHPDLTLCWFISPYIHKLWPNLVELLQSELPLLGRTWVMPLFMAGWLMSFRGPAPQRLRYFVLMCLGTLLVVQALGRTTLTELSPEITSENVLVILLPLILMYGCVFFFTFLEQFGTPVMLHPLQFRYAMIGLFIAVMSLPFLNTLLGGRSNPIAYPPYYPPEVSWVSSWMKPDELMMSDVPWAVAWYGHRQCVWLTYNNTDEFLALNDYLKTVHAVYLTPVTLDQKLRSDCIHAEPDTWANFGLRKLTGGDTPGFPLREMPAPGTINSGIFVTDVPRWLLQPQH